MVLDHQAAPDVLLVSNRHIERMTILTSNDIASSLDILLTRHEHQDITLRHRQMNLQDLLDGAIDIVLTWGFTMINLDRERTSWNRICRRIPKELRKLLRIHRGRSNDQFEITSSRQDLPQ